MNQIQQNRGCATAGKLGWEPKEEVTIGDGDAAFQVAFDVLEGFGFLTVDVAGEVEVEVILFDLSEGDHAGMLRDLETFVENTDDFADVLVAKAVFVAILIGAPAPYKKTYNVMLKREILKPLRWIGSSRKDVRAFPRKVRLGIGAALYAAQKGVMDPAAKPMKGLGAGWWR